MSSTRRLPTSTNVILPALFSERPAMYPSRPSRRRIVLPIAGRFTRIGCRRLRVGLLMLSICILLGRRPTGPAALVCLDTHSRTIGSECKHGTLEFRLNGHPRSHVSSSLIKHTKQIMVGRILDGMRPASSLVLDVFDDSHVKRRLRNPASAPLSFAILGLDHTIEIISQWLSVTIIRHVYIILHRRTSAECQGR